MTDSTCPGVLDCPVEASFDFYGVAVKIRSDAEEVVSRFERCCAAFRRPEAGPPELEISFMVGEGDPGDDEKRKVYARFPADFDLWEGSLIYFICYDDAEKASVVRRGIQKLDCAEPGQAFCRLSRLEFLGRDWYEGLELLILCFVMRRLSRYFVLHAATVAKNGRALLFMGPSGSGKSVLSCALARGGFEFLSDEYAPFDPASMEVLPYPRPIYFKDRAAELFPDLRPHLQGGGPLPAILGDTPTFQNLGMKLARNPARASFLFFLTHRPGVPPELEPVPAQDAVVRLENSWDLMVFSPPEARKLTRYDAAAALGSNARCYDLVSGYLDKTVDLIEALV